MSEPRGRLFQDNHFVFTEFDGLKLEKMVVCEVPENKAVAMVFIKTLGNDWHYFTLDYGFAVWNHCGEIEQDDSYNYIDKTEEYGISQKKISKIWCEPIENNCQIIIEFENKDQFILRTINPKIWDDTSEIVFVKRNP